MTTIGLISDIHFGYVGLSDTAVLDALHDSISALTEQGVEAVFLLGDLIHENSVPEDKENLETVYSIFEENFETVIALGGNHDAGNLTAEEFSAIVENSVSVTQEVDGQTFVCIDTAFTSAVTNIGQIEGRGFELLESADENPVVLTHFPITYTTRYRKNEYFSEYPEGVFAINKFRFNQKRDAGEIPEIQQIITGHLHTPTTHRDNHGTWNTILQPFCDIRIDPASESSVLGSIYTFDTDALADDLADPLQKHTV